MNEDELLESIGKIIPTSGQREKMLERILTESRTNAVADAGGNKRRGFARLSVRLILPSVCVALLLLLIGVPLLTKEEPLAEIPQLTPMPATLAAPLKSVRGELPGLRKFLNYNGFRYEFLDNGDAFNLSGAELGEKLGTLDYDLSRTMSSPGSAALQSRNFATTFQAGGMLYAMKSYDPAFRLAVEKDGSYYVAQLAGKADNSIMDAAELMKHADLNRLTKQVEIYNGNGATLLQRVDSRKMIESWIRELSKSEAAIDLTDTQQEAIANAEHEGGSYQLKFQLRDGTSIRMIVLPKLGLITIGNGKYYPTESLLENFRQLVSN
ncbi:hypothetical protein [Paenibacillus sp. HB172176]|uniref:hypothetical protein n=1 Tax=Paenibacillus sp. HB172176 TaxID=2493690 RepID=UPI00143BD5E6|nr:hypothetical protein [Paenibacillus sp. HB172176]